jgi:glucose/arabinose dehydrogenase
MRVLAALLVLLTGCFKQRPSKGGGEVPAPATRATDPADVAVPAGYRIEPVAQGFVFPTAVAFDDKGVPHVLESGYAYGEVFTTPRLLRVAAGGTTVVASGDNGPWTGMSFAGGAFYVAEGGETRGGRILRITPQGEITALVEDLPSVGDHHTNGAVVGPDGWIYFGQGTATNSGVVGPDNRDFGWLARHPDFHDVPCRDVTLSGASWRSPNVLAPGGGEVETGPFLSFGTPAEKGQLVRGKVPCNGAVMRVRPEGGEVELVAWGFRNPFGLAFDAEGRLYVTDNGYDDRGSRPVFGAADMLWQVEPGRWYGWPDYSEGRPLTRDRFTIHGEDGIRPALDPEPDEPPQPVAYFAVHSSSDGLDFSRNPAFGHVGEAFVAQFGDQAPVVGKVLHPVGFKVIRVEVDRGVSHDFAVNRGSKTGPASRIENNGLERPVAVRFDPTGRALYVVDFGILSMTEEKALPRAGTGVLWKITREVSP